jgi:hypothetical protein
MAMLAIKDIYRVVTALAPSARTTTANGTTVDLNNANANMVTIHPGTITDGTHTPKLQDSPDGSTWTDVDASLVVGSFTAIASSTIQKVSYIGAQRYIRLVVTVTGSPATGGVYGSTCVFAPRKQP